MLTDLNKYVRKQRKTSRWHHFLKSNKKKYTYNINFAICFQSHEVIYLLTERGSIEGNWKGEGDMPSNREDCHKLENK